MRDKAFVLFCNTHNYFKLCYSAGERNREYSQHIKAGCIHEDFVKPRFPVIIDTDPEFLTLSAVKKMYQKMIEERK